MDITDQILNLPLPLLHSWGYWLVLASAFFEAMPFGFLVPGQVIVVASGFAAKLGIFSLGDLVWVAALGAVLGDLISYLVGRTYGHSFLARYGHYFFFREEYFNQTRKLMNEHVGKTIIIGRFNLITRSFAPFVAGSCGISYHKFLFYDIIGGAAWAISSILVGYIFGQSFELAARVIGLYITAAVAISLLLVITLRYVNKKKYIFTRQYLPTLTVNIAALYFFAKITDDVVKQDFIVRLDLWLDSFLWRFTVAPFDTAMVFITNFFSPPSLAAAGVLLILLLAIRRLWFKAAVLAAGLSGGFFLSVLIKDLVMRVRPLDALATATDFSFPSTHAVMATVFFFFLVYIVRDNIASWWRRYIFILACLLAVLLTGFSRLYLHVHWLTDVIAGYLLGLFWGTIVIIGLAFFILAYKQGILVYNKFGDRMLVALGWPSWKSYLVKQWHKMTHNT
jgi:undecaprenyl-diphosphatase